jgi:hypothetical protein
MMSAHLIRELANYYPLSLSAKSGMGNSMAFSVDRASAPTIVNSSVERTREYLTRAEVEKLMERPQWRPWPFSMPPARFVVGRAACLPLAAADQDPGAIAPTYPCA